MEELIAMALERSALFDHLNHEGLARGHIEGVDESLKRAQGEDFADGDAIGQCERGENE
jgi:hypothetical protein